MNIADNLFAAVPGDGLTILVEFTMTRLICSMQATRHISCSSLHLVAAPENVSSDAKKQM